jgi:TRAP-type C4-dicarboxylate transport system permease small subunit
MNTRKLLKNLITLPHLGAPVGGRLDVYSSKGQGYLGMFAGIVLLALMFLTCADIFGRYVLLKPVAGTKEIGQLMMAGLTYLGMGYALVVGAHVRLTFVRDNMPRRVAFWAGMFVLLAGLVFFGIHAYGSWGVFWRSVITNEAMYATIWLPWWLGKLFVFLGAALICLQFLIHLIIRKV